LIKFLARRLIFMFLGLLIVSMIVFGLSRLQGDPRLLYLSESTTQVQWDAWGEEMGLDRPVPVQYFVWLGKAVTGDLGKSLREPRPVTTIVLERLPATLELGVVAWVLAILVGWPIGILSAIKRGTIIDYIGRSFALVGQALPPFFVGIVLILIFSVELGWLPTARRGGVEHLILPAITLGWLAASAQLRIVRSAMLEVLDSEYVKFARAKGVSSRGVILKHALRNALIPPLTLAGLVFASFIGGTVVTESVFAWPGIGRLAVDSVFLNDFPVLAGVILLTTSIYLLVNFCVDILYVLVDPRIRYE
jgi:peptide/nickel transport system permease protein